MSEVRSWNDRFQEIVEYSHRNGHTRVPKAQGALGRWVARQRELRKAGKMDPLRVAALDSIGFTWKVIESAWVAKYQKLVEWKKETGHTCVPISNRDLGSWVSKQRQSKKRGKLAKEKVEALESIHFTWSTSEEDWNEKFNQLCKWKLQHGSTIVPFNEGGLGWWSNTQRQSKKKGKLSKERERKLDLVDFEWNPSNRRPISKKQSSCRRQISEHCVDSLKKLQTARTGTTDIATQASVSCLVGSNDLNHSAETTDTVTSVCHDNSTARSRLIYPSTASTEPGQLANIGPRKRNTLPEKQAISTSALSLAMHGFSEIEYPPRDRKEHYESRELQMESFSSESITSLRENIFLQDFHLPSNEDIFRSMNRNSHDLEHPEFASPAIEAAFYPLDFM